MLTALLVGSLLYAGYGFTLYAAQDALLYPGVNRSVADDSPPPAPIEQIWFEDAGVRVEAWWLPATRATASAPAPLLLVAHGNYELIDDQPYSFGPLTMAGLHVLLVEFPGYGRSGGRPTEDSIAAVMRAAYDTARSREEVDPTRIYAYGRSLGGGAAARLTRERDLAGLILHSTFTDLRVFARDYWLPGILLRDHFDNLDALRRYARPVLILHGRNDEAIPHAHAQRLHAAAPESTLHSFDCGHNNCPADPATLRGLILEFMHQPAP